jgi:hypothetical protein
MGGIEDRSTDNLHQRYGQLPACYLRIDLASSAAGAEVLPVLLGLTAKD